MADITSRSALIAYDSRQAKEQGWDIVDCYDDYQLQRDDEQHLAGKRLR